jgi:hypothetical protein
LMGKARPKSLFLLFHLDLQVIPKLDTSAAPNRSAELTAEAPAFRTG